MDTGPLSCSLSFSLSQQLILQKEAVGDIEVIIKAGGYEK